MRSCPSIPLMSYPTVSFLSPLALLASWRLNSPAFTHDADRIASKWTVHPTMGDPIRGTAKTPRTPRRWRAWSKWEMRSCPSIPLMSYPTVSFLPLALLASWRLNSPAFTHDTDRIEYLRTVYRPWSAPKKNRQDAKDAKKIERLEQVGDALVPIHTADVLSNRVFLSPWRSWRLGG